MITDFFDNLIMIDKKTIPDGFGGFESQYTEGAEFKGGITTDNRMETRKAEKDGVTALYTVTVIKNIPLNYGDVIKRKEDNKYFKIVSNPDDMKTPKVSNMDFKQAQAELWTMPTK